MKAVSLFCGCGGFTSGAFRAGFDVPMAYDFDPILTSAFEDNFPKTKLKLGDISELTGSTVIQAAGGEVDGLFGGPPCQGFSTIGRRELEDPRRLLVGQFFRLVNEIKPTFFVMENVVGLNQGQAAAVLEQAQEIVRNEFDILPPLILDASDFGAATRRRRLFSIGLNLTRADRFSIQLLNKHKLPATSVEDAIKDLENPTFVSENLKGLDLWRVSYEGSVSRYAKSLRSQDLLFTGNRRTVHTEAVKKRFQDLEPGRVDAIGRHPRLEWSSTCPTLRAGTGSDKGSYQSVRPVHPSEPRVITVREAARLQGFHDSHVFHPTIWHSFRMIGNSVSPFVAEAIFRALSAGCEPAVDQGVATQQAAE
jgi:DNA (cytosine-5)-methyltransferase 1